MVVAVNRLPETRVFPTALTAPPVPLAAQPVKLEVWMTCCVPGAVAPAHTAPPELFVLAPLNADPPRDSCLSAQIAPPLDSAVAETKVLRVTETSGAWIAPPPHVASALRLEVPEKNELAKKALLSARMAPPVCGSEGGSGIPQIRSVGVPPNIPRGLPSAATPTTRASAVWVLRNRASVMFAVWLTCTAPPACGGRSGRLSNVQLPSRFRCGVI